MRTVVGVEVVVLVGIERGRSESEKTTPRDESEQTSELQLQKRDCILLDFLKPEVLKLVSGMNGMNRWMVVGAGLELGIFVGVGDVCSVSKGLVWMIVLGIGEWLCELGLVLRMGLMLF